MTKPLSIKSFTTPELLREIERRTPKKPRDIFDDSKITPYMVVCAMVMNKWQENPVFGETTKEVKFMWEYLGYPHLSDDDSWCAATVNFCLKVCGYATSMIVPVARSFTDYGAEVHANNLKKGDIAVFKRKYSDWRGHVGFVSDATPMSVMVTGGNQNNKVCTKFYNKDGENYQFIGYRKPVIKTGPVDVETLKEVGLYETIRKYYK
jgi:uncharacterized protein (TIGR02594 family)